MTEAFNGTADVERIVRDLGSPEVSVRANAAGRACDQLLIGQSVRDDHAREALVSAVIGRLEISANGQALEADSSVKLLCIRALENGVLFSDVSRERALSALEKTAERDPIDIVKAAAKEAVEALNIPRIGPNTLPSAKPLGIIDLTIRRGADRKPLTLVK